MYAEERQHEIVARARDLGRVSVAELAAAFDVTPETIRRDLDLLAGRGLVNRVHGGAVAPEKVRLTEEPVGARDEARPEQKTAIARRAAALLPDRAGLTVLLDAGTTTGRLIEFLPPRVTLVVTNSLPTASTLSTRSDLEVYLLGGLVRGITQASVGARTVSELGPLRVDVAFMGTNGFSVEHGFSTPDPAEGEVKKAMWACAHQVHVLADSSKMDQEHLVRFAPLDAVDTLVTDAGLADVHRESLEAAGLRVEIA